uniref:Uncharacterized protein n=1 Tax=Arundo donax TaxID=35708 RepID=A0A0A9DNG7_ARUDO
MWVNRRYPALAPHSHCRTRLGHHIFTWPLQSSAVSSNGAPWPRSVICALFALPGFLRLESKPGRGRNRGPKSSGNGNMEESLT